MTTPEGIQKAPFSIATTPFPGLLHLIPTLLCWVLSKEVSSTIFESLVRLDLGLNPGLLGH